ncbi:MAG: ribosome-associated translation inhibitor RaiA [Caulobacterales bacterium]
MTSNAIQVSGLHVAVGDALRSRITEELTSAVDKYFGRSAEANVTVGKEGHGFEVDCMVRLPSGIALQAQGFGSDAHGAWDDALEKFQTRIRKYKGRLRNHHNGARDALPAESAASFVLQSVGDDHEVDGALMNGDASEHPVVVAETTVDVKTMTVSMAVLQLELLESPALMFRNAAHGGLGMVYRRADGHIGWIDPERSRSRN